MNDRQRETIRKRLLEERAGRLEVLAEMDDRFRSLLETGDDDLSKYPQHPADDGTDTMEQEKEFLIASQEGRQLLDIDESLRSLYKEPETFGQCDNCGREIAMDRLEMVPWTRLCIDCQEASEAGAATDEEPAAR